MQQGAQAARLIADAVEDKFAAIGYFKATIRRDEIFHFVASAQTIEQQHGLSFEGQLIAAGEELRRSADFASQRLFGKMQGQ